MDEPRLLGGRYELAEVLGYGGMAQVYRGVDRRLGRTVAVKTLRTDLVEAATFRARFRREARAAAALDHPSIVRVYDTGEDTVDTTTVPYIVMEYVEGQPLSEILRADERLSTDRALEITGAVLAALRYSHESGIVHRDIKPGNVMITESGDVKVMDFGIARVLDDGASTMTSSSMVIGTAHYLSPEQARGETADARSDLYSAGCMLYELLAGRPPFLGESAVSVAYQHVREEPRLPSAYEADVPAAAEAVVIKALAKDPRQRYQSAGEMLADLHRARIGQPVSAPLIDREPTTDQMEAVTEVVGDAGLGADDPADAGPADGSATLPAGDEGAQGPGVAVQEGDNGARRRRVLLAAVGLAIVAVIGVAAFTVPGWFGDDTGANGGGERDRGPVPAEETAEPTDEAADDDPAEQPTTTSTSEPTRSESGQRSTPNPAPTTTAPATEDSDGNDEPRTDTPTPDTGSPEPDTEDGPTTTPPPETEEPTDPPEDEESPTEPSDPPEDDETASPRTPDADD